jgi:hypothetical protein
MSNLMYGVPFGVFEFAHMCTFKPLGYLEHTAGYAVAVSKTPAEHSDRKVI